MLNKPTVASDIAVPLVVDLDGTLLRTDSLMESILELVRRHPLLLPWLPIWAMRGRAAFKRRLAEEVTLDPATFPYHGEFLDYLRRQRAAGRKLVLATGADESIANAVAAYLGIFDQVIASDGIHNYSGLAKRQELSRRFGLRGYDYAGNHRVDLKVWAESHAAIPVACSPSVARRAAELVPIAETFPSESSPIAILAALHFPRWAENLVVFLPILVPHHLPQRRLFSLALEALYFLCLSLCDSGVYLLGDLVNLSADRRNPAKRDGPFVAGRVPLAEGLTLALLLIVAAFVLAARTHLAFLIALSVYFAVNGVYSLYFRGRRWVGILVAIVLYALRLISGTTVMLLGAGLRKLL
jgi:phosphoserine phosphatase